MDKAGCAFVRKVLKNISINPTPSAFCRSSFYSFNICQCVYRLITPRDPVFKKKIMTNSSPGVIINRIEVKCATALCSIYHVPATAAGCLQTHCLQV